MTRSKQFIEQLLKEYNEGASMQELNQKYHTDTYYQFKKLKNVQKRTIGEQHALSRTNCYVLNWNCKTISNEKEAYILGMLYADGYISGNQQIGLRLKDTDKNLVEEIKNYFSKEIKLQYDKRKKCYGFVVSSKVLVENLETLGMLRHKTNIEFSMPNIPENLQRHFIRGYFDGDGSIYMCKKDIKTPYLKGYICSPTKTILENIQSVLLSNDIDCKINFEKRKGRLMRCVDSFIISSCDMYRLFIRKKEALRKFYHFLYDDCSIYLERKKEVFDKNFEFLNYIHANTEIN